MNLCMKFTSLSSNPAAANSKPEAKKRSQSNNPTRTWRSLVNQPVPFPKKTGCQKNIPSDSVAFFGGHIPASPMPFGMKVLMLFMYLGWELGWVLKHQLRQKNMGETGFFQRKTLGSVIMVFELRVNFSWIIHPPMSHSLLILWVWILYSWYSYVCTIHFYAGHTPSFMVHN